MVEQMIVFVTLAYLVALVIVLAVMTRAFPRGSK
jgi:hypothetical protein